MPSDRPPARVTRDVDPTSLSDLLAAPRRAAVAFVDNDEVMVLPARARVLDGAHQFGVDAVTAPDLSGHEVVLTRDDGPYWFELRGISVRGIATRLPAAAGLAWYAVTPHRIIAWDYAAVREE